MAAEDPASREAFYPGGRGEYRLATDVAIHGGERLIYLDFLQAAWPEADDRPSNEPVLGLARVAVHPEVAADLLAKLSELLDR